MLHLLLHVVVPAAVAGTFYRRKWRFAWLCMMLGMIVDLDHLLADPIYDASRCSIGFHPLHELWFIAIYLGLCLPPKTRLIGLGLTIHMALDAIDCQFSNGVWMT